MSRLQWDEADYEVGIDRGVFYPKNSPVEVWNGLITVEEMPKPISSRAVYLDGVKIASGAREDAFSAKVSAYFPPSSFYTDIEQYRQQSFGFSYRVRDKIHLVYNAYAGPTERTYQYNEVEAYSWDISTVPIALPEGGFTSHLIVDESTAYPTVLSEFENILYGTDVDDARLPSPSETFDMFELNAILRVIDNGDGTFTVIGPDDAIQMLDATTFQITWPTAVYIDSSMETYTISSF